MSVPANDEDNTTSSSSSSRVASFASPAIAGTMGTPIAHDALSLLGFWSDLAHDLVYFAMGGFALGLINIVASLFTGMIEIFLFPPAPMQIAGIEDLYMQSTFAFFSIITVTGLGYFGYMMVFPHNQKADPFRYINRLFAALILLAAGKYLLNSAVLAVNALGQFIYPNSFKINFLVDSILDLLLVMPGAILAILVAIIILKLTAIATILGFFAILAIRALLVYAVYALFPIFIALWVVDVGPFKYGSMVAELAFKSFALLLSFGILIAAILATGAAIAGAEGQASNPGMDNLEQLEDRVDEQEAASHCEDVAGSDEEECDRGGIILKLMALFGSLWASLAIGASSLGMLISMKGSGGATARSGSSGGSTTQTNEVSDAGGTSNENVEAGPQSLSGRINQVKADYEEGGVRNAAQNNGMDAVKGVAGAVDSFTDTIAQSGNNSMMGTMKSGFGKAKDTVGAANDVRTGDTAPDSAVEDVQENVDSMEGNNINMNGAQYDAESGQLTDRNGENGIDYEPGEDGPELEDGQRYDLENVGVEKDDEGNAVVKGNEETEADERIPTGSRNQDASNDK